MDSILSLVNKYPHLLVYFFLTNFITVIQLRYGQKAHYYKDEKSRRQYMIVNIITVIVLLYMAVTAIHKANPFHLW